jgi:protein-disulfide isomerase
MRRTISWQLLERVATVGVIAASAVFLWAQFRPPTTRPEFKIPKEPISFAGSMTAGKSTAKVGLLVYSDFQCPYCAKFAKDSWPEILHTYVDSGKVLVAFHHLPLPMHPLATGAAVAAECAGMQGQFWEMHDILFSDQKRFSQGDFLDDARLLKLNDQEFTRCLAGSASETVKNAASEAGKLGISSTPTFVIGTIEPNQKLKASAVLRGARPMAEFSQAIERAIR